MRYPYSVNAVQVCPTDEKSALGDRWKRVLGRFVHLLKSIGFKRSISEESQGSHVYDKANVAVVLTRQGIPSIRGIAGRQPDDANVESLKGLWTQAKKAMS